jgi:VanZ family protein
MHTTVFTVYAAIVAVTSLRPGTGAGIEHLDKLVHLLVYYIFAVLGYRALAGKPYYLHLCLGIIAYGGLIELGQSHIPGRDMSGYDFLANTLGVLLGAAVATRRRRGAST